MMAALPCYGAVALDQTSDGPADFEKVQAAYAAAGWSDL